MTNVTISSVRFYNFKALGNYSVKLQDTNILVGPNNAGKSTIISAFRILDIALKRAKRLKVERVPLPSGLIGYGHRIPENQISVSLENVATNYNTEHSKIEFTLTNKNKLHLFFPQDGGCILHWDTERFEVTTPSKFKQEFPINIQVVPVLGPLEHEETYINKDTVKNALNTHRACRHFRNYWYYFDEGWDIFSSMINDTWPGMYIDRPELDVFSNKLSMFVSENRIDREIYWAGFGFQVWCQLLTHLSRANDVSLVIIDEPEIYLHPDIQRQLLNILRGLNADILLATHSVEIMGEADPSEILLVNKEHRSARRLKDIKGIQIALESLGSTQNITLTHLAKTKKILFVEGMTDYKIIRRFAKKLNYLDLSSGNDITAFESGGFSSWEKVKSFAWGLKNTIDSKIKIFAVYDRDYFCQEELTSILDKLKEDLSNAHIHNQKEIENYLLNINVLERVLDKQIKAKNQRNGSELQKDKSILSYLEEITHREKSSIQAQYITKRLNFFKGNTVDPSTINKQTLEEFEEIWRNIDLRMQIVPGKSTLKNLREYVQRDYSITLTDIQIIDEFQNPEISPDMLKLIKDLEEFRLQQV